MAHISDVHAHLPESAIKLTDTQGIVEVLCILGVDSTSEDITEILATVYFLLRDSGVDLLCSILHILRILVRQVVLCKYRMHLGIVLASLSEHIDH